MFELATHLHKTVWEIENEMAFSEMLEWSEYFGIKNEEHEAARKQSEKGAKKPKKTTRIGGGKRKPPPAKE